MKSGRWRLLGIVPIVCMVAIVAVSAAMGGCGSSLELASGGTAPMRCAWAFSATALVGIAGAIAAALALAASNVQARRIAAALTLAIAVVIAVLLSPVGIGVCTGAAMDCHVSAYAVWALSAIAAVFALVQIAKADPAAADRPKMSL